MQTRVSTETAVIESSSRKLWRVARSKGSPHTFFAAMIAIGSGRESIWYSAPSVCSADRHGNRLSLSTRNIFRYCSRTAVSPIDDSYMSIQNWKLALSTCLPSSSISRILPRPVRKNIPPDDACTIGFLSFQATLNVAYWLFCQAEIFSSGEWKSFLPCVELSISKLEKKT